MQLTESDRELLVDYLAQFFAEDLVGCESDHFEASRGWVTDDEEFLYHVLRTQPLGDWKLFPLDDQSDDDLMQFFVDRFGPDPENHLMDRWVVGKILDSAL